jgi:hypothetical protein
MHLLLSSQVSGVIGLGRARVRSARARVIHAGPAPQRPAFSPRETCEPEATQSTYGIVRDWSVQPPGPT